MVCRLLGDTLVVLESGDKADVGVQSPEQDDCLLVDIWQWIVEFCGVNRGLVTHTYYPALQQYLCRLG